MAINKKLITFDKKLTFLGANGINNLSSPVDGYYNLIPTWSMVFIKDTGEIWHDGVYFGKPIKDQIAPIMSGTTKGIVFTPNGTDYYYKDFNLWGNTFDGDTKNINGDLVVQGVTYKWTYGDLGIKKGNTNLISFSNSANDYDVFIPNGDLLVTGGDINVNNGKVILDSTGYIKGTHILNTNSYFNADNTLGKTWSSIKQFNTSGTTISLDTTRPAIINIQEHAHASGTLWVPWIAGGDITELSSWGIGLGGDAFYIGRIDKSHTENSLSEYWKFDATDGITISGATKYIKVADLSGASEKVFMADGTVKALSDITSEAVIGEATTTNYGGFKLTQDKASSQQSLVANTTGNGRYAVKMNANGTLYVEFSQANTWLPATDSQEGYVPQLSGTNEAIGSNLNDYVLMFTASDGDETIYPVWKRLPTNAFENTTYSTATDSTLGLVKVGTTLDNVTGFTAVHIKDGKIYYKDTTYSFSNLKFQLTSGTDLMTYNSLAAKTILAGTGITFSYLNNVLTISSAIYSTATDSILGLVKVGTTVEDTTGYTKVHIDDSGFIYYHDTTYSFSKLKFQQTSGTDLMTYDSQAARTILAGDNITFTHSSNVLTIKATDTWTKFVGATDSSNGTAGYIDAPGKSNKNNFLRGDGTWLSLESNVTSALYVGASNGTSTAAQSTNGSVYLIFKEGSSYSRYLITGSGRASVTSDSSGNITISSSGYSNFTAATASTAGSAGLVPGPGANQLGSGGYYLKADGTWDIPTNTWKEVSTSQEGYVPKIVTTGSLTSSDNPFILVYKNVSGITKSVWVPLPANAFNNTWTAADFTNAGYVPKSVKGKFLHAKSDTGALEWVDDNNTWDAASTSKAGYVPKLATGGGTIASSDTAYVLAYKSGVSGTTAPVWILLPSNAYNNTWIANAVGVAGYVAAPTKAANANMVWKTNSEGVPAWRADANDNTEYYLTLNGTVNGTSGKTNLGTFYAIATSDTTTANQVWMRNSSNNGYGWRTLGSHAFDSTTYSTTDENVKQTPKTDNVNRPLMMINGGTATGTLTSTSMFSTGIYANASTKMITANGFVKAGSDSSHVLLGDGGQLHIDTIMSRLYDDGAYKYSGNNPYYAHMSWNTNSDNRWYLRVSPENPKLIAVDWAYGVSWDGITGKPNMNKIIRGYTLEEDFIQSPIGGEYHTRNSSKTGCITISLPSEITGQNGIKDPMVSMWIDVYLYSQQKSFTVFVGGYPYSGNTWANAPLALVIGADHRVRLGYSNSRFVIYIGETNSIWGYPQIKVRDVQYGYMTSTSAFQGEWSIGFSTSVENVTFDTTTYVWTTKNFNPENYSVTSHQHYIGTTQTQTNSAYQALAGITRITTNWASNTDYYCDMLIDSTTWMNFTTNCTSFYFNKSVSSNGNIYPYVNATYSLGDSAHYWTTIYGNATSASKIISLGSYSYVNLSKDIPVNALSYKIVDSGGTDLGDTQYNVIHIPWYSGDWGSYILFGANNGRVGVKYKHGGAVRELITSANFSDFMDDRYVNVTGDTMSGALYMSLNAKGILGVDAAGMYILSGSYWLRALVGGVNDCQGALSISNYLTTSAYANIGTYLQTGTYAYIKGAIANNDYKLVRLLGQYTCAGSCTGTIKITLPNNSSQYQMHYIRIHVYEYSSQGASTITLGGHDWNGNWYNHSYTVKGNYNKGVRLGYDGTNYCILLGTTSTTWSYPGVWVDALDNVYNTSWDNVFLNGCTCSLITSESGITTFNPSLGNSYASTFYGALSGNASSASKLVDSNSSSNTITASYYSGGYTSSPAYLTAWSGYHLTYCEPKYVTGIGSANKLNTARSLWGNTFDGTLNLTGRLTIQSDIRCVPTNSSYEVFQFGALNSSTHTGYIYGETNSYYLVFSGGNTGVGINPSYKLDVNGNELIRGHLFINNTLAEQDINFIKNGAYRYQLCGHDANFIFCRYNGSWKLDTLWNYSTGGWTFNQQVYFNRGGENTPSIRWNKGGSYWGGIGYGGTSNENVFGPVDANGNWVTSTSPDIWTFRGDVKGYNFYTTSDRSKKQNISSFSEHIRKFQLKDTEKWHYGVIAQEVEEMFRDGEEGNMTVNYNSVLSYYVGMLENKVKELEEKIKLLETK